MFFIVMCVGQGVPPQAGEVQGGRANNEDDDLVNVTSKEDVDGEQQQERR